MFWLHGKLWKPLLAHSDQRGLLSTVNTAVILRKMDWKARSEIVPRTNRPHWLLQPVTESPETRKKELASQRLGHLVPFPFSVPFASWDGIPLVNTRWTCPYASGNVIRMQRSYIILTQIWYWPNGTVHLMLYQHYMLMYLLPAHASHCNGMLVRRQQQPFIVKQEAKTYSIQVF